MVFSPGLHLPTATQHPHPDPFASPFSLTVVSAGGAFRIRERVERPFGGALAQVRPVSLQSQNRLRGANLGGLQLACVRPAHVKISLTGRPDGPGTLILDQARRILRAPERPNSSPGRRRSRGVRPEWFPIRRCPPEDFATSHFAPNVLAAISPKNHPKKVGAGCQPGPEAS